VTPHLNDSDLVRLDVDETISDTDGLTPVGSLGVQPYTERQATTTLTVRDGESVVIGGLVRNSKMRVVTKVPILGDIPLLGVLFRSTEDKADKRNLVLVLTPYIIRDQSDMRRIYERKKQELDEFRDHNMVFNNQKYDVPKDYSRARGLLGEIRNVYREVDDQRVTEEARQPRAQQPHVAREPLDPPVPTNLESRGVPVAPANVQIAPPARNVERIER